MESDKESCHRVNWTRSRQTVQPREHLESWSLLTLQVSLLLPSWQFPGPGPCSSLWGGHPWDIFMAARTAAHFMLTTASPAEGLVCLASLFIWRVFIQQQSRGFCEKNQNPEQNSYLKISSFHLHLPNSFLDPQELVCKHQEAHVCTGRVTALLSILFSPILGKSFYLSNSFSVLFVLLQTSVQTDSTTPESLCLWISRVLHLLFKAPRKLPQVKELREAAIWEVFKATCSFFACCHIWQLELVELFTGNKAFEEYSYWSLQVIYVFFYIAVASNDSLWTGALAQNRPKGWG